MNHTESAYGLWSLVIINSAIFIMFAFSFFKPATARDWRTFGAFAAFIVALFVEMYGFPLTIYLISGWLQTKFPNLDLLSHTSGHLWFTLFGRKGRPAFRRTAHRQLRFSGLWFLPVVHSVECALPRSAWPIACNNRPLRAHSPSAVRGFCDDSAGFPAAVAHLADLGHVPCLAPDVRTSGNHRRERNAQTVRCNLRHIRPAHTPVYPSHGQGPVDD